MTTNQKVAGSSPAERATKSPANEGFVLFRSVTVSRSVILVVVAARCLGLAAPVVWVAGGAVRGFVLGFGVYDLDHRHHPVVLVVEDVAVEHELPGEVGEAGTHLYRTVGLYGDVVLGAYAFDRLAVHLH